VSIYPPGGRCWRTSKNHGPKAKPRLRRDATASQVNSNSRSPDRFQVAMSRSSAAAALACMGALLCALPSPASATPLRRLAPRITSFASDGVRYAAWQVNAAAPIVVLDTRTGKRRAIPVPGCVLADQSRSSVSDGGGRFLLTCSPDEPATVTRCGCAAAEPSGARAARRCRRGSPRPSRAPRPRRSSCPRRSSLRRPASPWAGRIRPCRRSGAPG
jgi:hypothetical protein